jgi:hypothetical protein
MQFRIYVTIHNIRANFNKASSKGVGGVMVRVLALRGLPLKKAHKDINFAYGQIYEKF